MTDWRDYTGMLTWHRYWLQEFQHQGQQLKCLSFVGYVSVCVALCTHTVALIWVCDRECECDHEWHWGPSLLLLSWAKEEQKWKQKWWRPQGAVADRPPRIAEIPQPLLQTCQHPCLPLFFYKEAMRLLIMLPKALFVRWMTETFNNWNRFVSCKYIQLLPLTFKAC